MLLPDLLTDFASDSRTKLRRPADDLTLDRDGILLELLLQRRR